ncbi:unnamed protein product [Linum trigynum]|uniref:RNase H type-1 domain-containing protein n=1 Tax=Linum trigynum TaxID=586398 RepID=A0AAV2DC37_9ROSI
MHLFPSLPTPPPLVSILDWLSSIHYSQPGETTPKVIYLLWQIWKTRNEKVFRASSPWPPATCSKAINDFTAWNSCPKVPRQLPPPPNQPRAIRSHLLPPPSNPNLVIHCDGLFLHDSQKATYGIVVFDSHGDICDGKADTILCSSPIEAEAKALLEAVRYAQDKATPCLIRWTVFP